MKKSTKGAVAAAAAAVLLTGGAGSLAYWTADGSANGSGSITSGTLTIDDATCGTWEYADDAVGAGSTVGLVVPGDEVTNSCTFKVGATGDHLSASVTAPTTVAMTVDGTSFTATVTTTYTLGGNAFDPSTGKVTSAADGKDLVATFDVMIPKGTNETAATKVNANDSQDVTASLDAITVSLSQDDPAAPAA